MKTAAFLIAAAAVAGLFTLAYAAARLHPALAWAGLALIAGAAVGARLLTS
jgi:hypothetical protein